ncbi:hypothetical protein PAXRUDRAFT_19124 [Paxillus rubicundulus Ve08.2h10]|uniref:Uncharacterized protein n=1 Tax=Paxillus rubicundulus Ve08.2h10 TaxID=930991 RepID=A0A0D0D5E6_9AGAM|nr:hypothetical protein PAXRUDRAFT_19124 [Paxillus rubicundulus Ve08.2h10]
MAIMLHSVVLHAADVERYFSGLGGTQLAKHCNLTVETFEALSKLCSSYTHHLYKLDRTVGKSTHRKHAHMHTHPHLGIDMDLVDKLVKTFTWVPPLAAESDESKESLSGPEAITDKELAEAFDAVDREKAEAHQAEVMSAVDPDLKLDGNEVLKGKV